MSNQAVFLDRDHTLIEDPGYLSDPSAVKLLPGVEVALKSLASAGYKLVVVTNQSAIARGLLTEEALARIHEELRRQLAEHGAHLDAIHYCPFHPEGTVEAYAKESDLRKPQPGMLLKAAEEMDIDLSASWMVGDSPRDIEAGQRAGCRTIRIRTRAAAGPEGAEDEDVQADFAVRNLVDAAKVILRGPRAGERPPREEEAAAAPAEPPGSEAAPAPAETKTQGPPREDSEVRRQILQELRQFVRARQAEEFSYLRLLAGVVQMVALCVLLITLVVMFAGKYNLAHLCATLTVALQVMALTLFTIQRSR